jgi:hypothetical protein
MVNDDMKISLSITPTWSLINEIKDKTEKFLKEKNASRELIDATIMCSTELMENAIKYGSTNKKEVNINFDLSLFPGKLCVTVTNDVENDKDAKNVRDHIDRLKKTKDAAKLYIDRLSQLMENPKPGISQLGLYRIAYEGEFALDYDYKNNILTVRAERKF